MENLWISRSPEPKAQTKGEDKSSSPFLFSSALSSTAYPDVIKRFLFSRNLTEQNQIDTFFTPSLKTMTDPSNLVDLDKGVARMVEAFFSGDRVCVYGDYDLDGSSGIALLYSGFQSIGFSNIRVYQPSRFKEGYGINSDAVETLAKDKVQVMVTVDCGITAIDEALVAKKMGLDLIITDHHSPRETLPDALAVINPNRKDDKSELGYLSGVGVGFYFFLGVRRALLKDSRLTDAQRVVVQKFDPKDLLDLFTVGTIADMVPLKKENHLLVKHGLQKLAQTKRAGLQELIERLDLDLRPLTSMDIAFSIAPKLNALSRLELEIRPLDLLMCGDDLKAKNLVTRVLELNDQRKDLQKWAEEKALELVDSEQPCLVVGIEGGHAGVVGLVAAKLVNLFGKPSFAVAFPSDSSGVDGLAKSETGMNETDVGVGSARSQSPDDNVTEALSSCAELLDKFGGHPQAAGFSVKKSNFQKFKAAVEEHFRAKMTVNSNARQLLFDTTAKLYEINDRALSWLEKGEPYGVDNPNPVFRVEKATVKSVRWLKELHLKLSLQSELGTTSEAIGFFAKGKWEVSEGSVVELLVEPQWNFWKGQKRLQLLIRDLKTKGD